MRRLHLLVGIAGFLAFIGTGQYMDLVHNHLQETPGTQRMLFRSTHIYLLMSSLLNVALGLYFSPPAAIWRRWLAYVGSLLILAGPVLFLVGFFTEPWLLGLDRPYSRPGLFGALGGIGFHLISTIGKGSDRKVR